jgi:hypothetical protein
LRIDVVGSMLSGARGEVGLVRPVPPHLFPRRVRIQTALCAPGRRPTRIKNIPGTRFPRVHFAGRPQKAPVLLFSATL